MTQDEIIEIVREVYGTTATNQEIRFAKLVAEKEREACALLCYEQRKNWDALACADAIRAGTRPRGQA